MVYHNQLSVQLKLENFGTIKMKTIVYTAIYGNYDEPKRQPLLEKPTLFTDKVESEDWEVRKVKRRESSPRMKAKYFKCHSHLISRGISIYIDGCGTMIGKDFIERCLEYLGDADMLAFKHPDRDCIYTEAEFCRAFKKYINSDIMGQVDDYRKQGWPEHAGLWACGLLVRRNNERVRRFNKLWWKHINKYTYQDQLSFPICVKESGVKLKTLELPLNDNRLIMFLTPHASLD